MMGNRAYAQHSMRMQRHSGAHHRLRTHPASILQRDFANHQVESRFLIVVVAAYYNTPSQHKTITIQYLHHVLVTIMLYFVHRQI